MNTFYYYYYHSYFFNRMYYHLWPYTVTILIDLELQIKSKTHLAGMGVVVEDVVRIAALSFEFAAMGVVGRVAVVGFVGMVVVGVAVVTVVDNVTVVAINGVVVEGVSVVGRAVVEGSIRMYSCGIFLMISA